MSKDKTAELPVPYPLPVPYETAASQFVDPFLRHYGFTVVFRPSDRDGKPLPGVIWKLDGRELLQHEAVRYAQEMHKRRKTAASLIGCD